MVTDEGDINCFPFIRSDPILLTFIGPVIRADWLDKLSLKVPTTIDEWHAMLKAFKDQNANGKGDTLPFSPWLSSIPGGLEHVVRRWRVPAACPRRRLGHHDGLLSGQWHGHVRPISARVQRLHAEPCAAGSPRGSSIPIFRRPIRRTSTRR